jgi:predicted nuclease of predicted toxin-antitoxin system
VKLLFDQHLSHKLVGKLSDVFPGSEHLRHRAMQRADDEEVWSIAKKEGFVIVTKDEDFPTRSMVRGHPPKVPWIRSGNCATELVETRLHKNVDEIARFIADPTSGFMALY